MKMLTTNCLDEIENILYNNNNLDINSGELHWVDGAVTTSVLFYIPDDGYGVHITTRVGVVEVRLIDEPIDSWGGAASFDLRHLMISDQGECAEVLRGKVINVTETTPNKSGLELLNFIVDKYPDEFEHLRQVLPK